MKSDDGNLSRWERIVDRAPDDALFVAGHKVEIDVVLQRQRRRGKGAASTQVVIEIRIGDAA
jgi:hypothetical protein